MSKQENIYYCQPVFRPPSEAYSLLIQLTIGCSFKCDFCVSNFGKTFEVRDIKSVKKDLDIAKKIYGPNIRKIFFLDGNAMVTPTDKLLEVTNYANKIFPNLERCGVYAHSRDILKKSDDQLEALSNAGLKIAYVGFESGYNGLLEQVHKHVTKQEHIEAAKKLMKANITLSATFINGLGGANDPELSKKHAVESADLVNKICPSDTRNWYISFLSLMIPPNTEIYKLRTKGKFVEMGSLDILKELKTFFEHIGFDNKNANCIFRSNHASNYLPIKGVLDRDRDNILGVINYGLTHTEILRSDLFRGL